MRCQTVAQSSSMKFKLENYSQTEQPKRLHFNLSLIEAKLNKREKNQKQKTFSQLCTVYNIYFFSLLINAPRVLSISSTFSPLSFLGGYFSLAFFSDISCVHAMPVPTNPRKRQQRERDKKEMVRSERMMMARGGGRRWIYFLSSFFRGSLFGCLQ